MFEIKMKTTVLFFLTLWFTKLTETASLIKIETSEKNPRDKPVIASSKYNIMMITINHYKFKWLLSFKWLINGLQSNLV